MSENEMPKNAPYESVEVGAPVEIRVYERENDGAGEIIAEFDFCGDTFGGSVDLDGLEGVSRTLAVDELVRNVAEMAYDEVYGDPVFRDEDEPLVGRVDVQRPWVGRARRPVHGWVATVENPEALAQPEPESEPEPEPEPEPVGTALNDAAEGDPVYVALGVSPDELIDLKLSPDEARELAHGRMPVAVAARLLRERETLELLKSAKELILKGQEDDGISVGAQFFDQGLVELDEVIRRFDPGE